MSLPDREDPRGKRVSLFVTCMVDMLYPEVGMSTVEVLEHLGCTVDFPAGQTCCGQPAFNTGRHGEAKQVAQQFLRAFRGAEVIVAPSGSCAAMIRHDYATLFADDRAWLAEAERAARITWELTEFIVEGLGVTDLKGRLREPRSFALHSSCHGLRTLGLGDAARTLIGEIENASLTDLNEHDVCCGFGGLFSVKMPELSGAMLARKTGNIRVTAADQVIGWDVPCIAHINGGLEKQGAPQRVRHIAEVLAESIRTGEEGQR